MTNIAGVPTNRHDTRAFFEPGKAPPIERTPLLNSLRNAGTPNWTFFVSGAPGGALGRIEAEAARSNDGARPFYSPRDTDHGPANTCIAQMARVFANEDAALRTVDGAPMDVSLVSTHAAPELARDLHNVGIATTSAAPHEGRPDDRGPWSEAEDKLKGLAGLKQFGEVGSSWGAGNVPAVKKDMTTPIDAKPAAPRQPHHVGVFDSSFSLGVGDLDWPK